MKFCAIILTGWLVVIVASLAMSVSPVAAKKHGAQELLKGYLASENEEYEHAIGHYTRAIASDNLSLPRLSDAYRARGDAYFYMERLDRALDDYNLALHINSKNSPALNNRGNAFTKKRLFDLAMSDFNAALRLDPRFALAYQNRANVHFYSGRFREAAKDYAHSLRLNPSDPNSAIWLFLTRKRAGENGAAEFRRNVSSFKLDDWTSSIIALFLGEMGLDEFLNVAKRRGRLGEICEAHFYIGQALLINGDRSTAMNEFHRAFDTCPTTYVEHTAAGVELRTLRKK